MPVGYPCVWESINNPQFNYGELATIKSMTGLHNFNISAREWIEETNAVGMKINFGNYD